MTNDNSTGIGTPKSYWFVAILFLAWNLVGIFNYLSSVKATPESLAVQGMTAEQIEFMLGVPAHYMAVFALAVWSGLLGAILMLVRSRYAAPIFVVSLIFVVISFVLDFVGGSFQILGAPYIGVMVVVLILAVIEVLYSRKMRARGILK